MATPRINATGAFTVKPPFVIDESKVYKCEAIQGFQALEKDNVDVFSIYYNPFTLEREVYEKDKLDQVDIVTLIDESESIIKIPSSYILTFPDQYSIRYKQAFLTVSLGALPEGFNLNPLKEGVQLYVDSLVGITSEAKLVTHPAPDQVDFSQHERLEAAREAAIKYQPTILNQLMDSQELVAKLNEKVLLLSKEIIKLKS